MRPDAPDSEKFTARRRQEPTTSIGMSVTGPQLELIHAIAAARQVTISNLLRTAIERTYDVQLSTAHRSGK